MTPDPVPATRPSAAPVRRAARPALFSRTERAERRFWEFFTAHIRNPNTRLAYLAAVRRFAAWCQRRGVTLDRVEPVVVAAHVEELSRALSPASVKQHLAALRMLFDWLVVGQVLAFNPAGSVRGPRHVVKSGKTPVLSAQETRALLDGIDVSTLVGLRDRAFLGVLVYSFARVSAAVSLRVGGDYTQGPRSFFRLHEKGGRYNVVPAHHTAQEYVDLYLEAADIAADRRGPLFRTTAPGPRDGLLEEGRAARGDLRAQLPRDWDHRVPAQLGRPRGGGPDRGSRLDEDHAALQQAARGDLARRDRAHSYLRGSSACPSLAENP